MRTHSFEKNRQRDRVLPAIRGHGIHEYDEFVPLDINKPNAPPYGRIFKREEWGAAPALKKDGGLPHPIMYIRTVNVFFEGEDGELEMGLKGADVVRRMQKDDMDGGMSDIRSNFIIDEDGLIYEGRGWSQKPAVVNHDDLCKNREYLEICYIGDFSSKDYNHPVHYATAAFMEMGIRKKYLSRNALMYNPKNKLYERKREPEMDLYLPKN